MLQTLKIVIPAAGYGTRMLPQTWSKPKPLVSVAGQTALDHLLASFTTIPATLAVEYIIIYSPGLGEAQLPSFMQEHYPQLNVTYVLQPEMKGQSDALLLARRHLQGPTIICFSDTLMETDFSFLAGERPQGVAWVKTVPDPRRFGVTELNAAGWVTRLVEKPTSLENNQVVIGCYYFNESLDLLSAIDEQVRRGISLKGEYFLTDAINIMIEHGLQMRTQPVQVWLDTGTIPATLETNQYLLEHGKANHIQASDQGGVRIIPPVFIHPSAHLANSVIGPHVSIAADCTLTNARLENSILEAGVTLEAVALKESFIGRHTRVQGRSMEDPPVKCNLGDNCSVVF